MASTYPSVVATLTNPTPTQSLNNPSHSSIHGAANDEIVQLETFIGTQSSAVGTLIYDIRAAASNGGGHVQTANKGGTGQTAYTKGDVLVGQSSSVLVRLAVGADNQVLVANSSAASGVNWAAAPTTIVSSFLVDATWTKPTAATVNSHVFVELWGAGGGGGAADTGTTAAGGGGGGGYASGWIPASMLSSSVIVGVGVGGAGGAAGSGGNGTNSVFDTVNSILTAYGGGGGSGNISTNGAGGGGGGPTQAGAAASSGTGGAGGNQAFNTFGGGTGGDTSAAGSVAGLFFASAASGGGGGGGKGAAGGAAYFGGGGGGGITSSALGAGGVSKVGGNGQAGSVLVNASMLAAPTPGGGGGASYGHNSTAGAGGSGKVIVTTFL